MGGGAQERTSPDVHGCNFGRAPSTLSKEFIGGAIQVDSLLADADERQRSAEAALQPEQLEDSLSALEANREHEVRLPLQQQSVPTVNIPLVSTSTHQDPPTARHGVQVTSQKNILPVDPMTSNASMAPPTSRGAFGPPSLVQGAPPTARGAYDAMGQPLPLLTAPRQIQHRVHTATERDNPEKHTVQGTVVGQSSVVRVNARTQIAKSASRVQPVARVAVESATPLTLAQLHDVQGCSRNAVGAAYPEYVEKPQLQQQQHQFQSQLHQQQLQQLQPQRTQCQEEQKQHHLQQQNHQQYEGRPESQGYEQHQPPQRHQKRQQEIMQKGRQEQSAGSTSIDSTGGKRESGSYGEPLLDRGASSKVGDTPKCGSSTGALQLSAVLGAARGETPLSEAAARHQSGVNADPKWERMQADLDATTEEPAQLFGRLLKTAPFG